MMQENNNYIDRRALSTSMIKLLNLRTNKPITNGTDDVMVSCPFHKDKTPSMGVNLKKGVCHCFSCDYSGSVEKTYKTVTGSSLYEALGISLDQFSSYQPIQTFNFSNYDETALKNVYVRYNPTAFIDVEESQACMDYLKGRGISLEVAKSMGMKYCEDSRINGTRFYRRLVIPVYEKGRLISIEGRRIFKEDPDPKVLYPKNCTVNSLFDIDKLDKNKKLFAVEGLMDLAVLRSCEFFKNSTSIFGASLTKRQLYLLKDFKSFTYIPDRDQAGEKTVEILKNSDLENVNILSPPQEINGVSVKDIGDIPKTGITIQQLLNNRWMDYEKKLDK
jgi:DNA primase